MLQAVPTERTIAAIMAMADEARRHRTEAIVAIGTAGLRAAENSAAFVEAVRARCGVHVEIISGEEEARLAFLAATADIEPVAGSLVVFETGGGSTQFTVGEGEGLAEQFSLPLGAVRIAAEFGLDGVVDDDRLASAFAAIDEELAPLDGRPAAGAIVAMGGAVTNLTAVNLGMAIYDPDVVQGSVLDVATIDRLIDRFRTLGAEQRAQIVGLQPNRAEVILAGACIVRTVLEKLGRESLTVSDRGLRHQVLVERFGL
jgi:exopolyphosphatase/guanosine-5'-triphosphate,3'-diphosphate pyrophosphatase